VEGVEERGVNLAEQQQPEQRPPYIDEGLVINTRLNEIERRQLEEKAEEKEYKRRQLRFNRLTLIFTALLFLTSAVSDWLLLRQSIVSRDSADAAKKSADAAKSAADTASDTLRFNRNFILGEMKKQSGAMQDAAEAARDQARISDRSSRAAEDALHLIESADMEFGGILCSEALSINTEVTVTFRNAGRTSATGITSFFYLGPYGAVIRMPAATPSVSSIGPGQQLNFTPIRMRDIVTENNAPLVRAGFLPLHAWGWVKYGDRFRQRRIVVVDFVYSPRTVCQWDTIREVSR